MVGDVDGAHPSRQAGASVLVHAQDQHAADVVRERRDVLGKFRAALVGGAVVGALVVQVLRLGGIGVADQRDQFRLRHFVQGGPAEQGLDPG
ncbi:hypothetical protein GCM10023205_03860 [Yinghuangia aomiensis]|uniref:Uncharacterized protein n=1 Tax=Yinghuangia aomiensis TaxID=676205 RepID=A0ABP9GLC3_9ACTN